MVLLGIVPADAQQMALGLTSVLAEAFPHFVDAAVREIRAQGVHAERVGSLSLDEVVEGLGHSAHPVVRSSRAA